MNICEFIDENGIKYPNKKAVVLPKNDIYSEFYTFKVFKEKTHQMAHYFSEKGIQRGHKVLVFIKPSLDSTAVVFALFRIGAVPVLMDPGMGLRNLLNSIKQCQPEALIGEPIVFLMSYVLRDAFKSVKIKLKLKSLTGSSHSLHKHLLQFDKDYKSANMNKDEMGAILFTSGGTGIPKGVVYTQEIFKAQTLKLKEMFELTPIDIDLPGFPLFSLFTLAIGMTSVIPQMDPSRPARCNPRKLVENIQNHRTTFIAGSPAIWSRVADYCIKENIQLETVKYLVMFGAPVSIELHEKFEKILPNGTTYTPYGATECLPVSNISGREILKQKKKNMLAGQGTCIGKAAPGVEIKIIKVTDEALTKVHEVENGVKGEIIVSSDTVTPEYYLMEEKTKLAKIPTKKFWHRMGDIGYLDDEGYLWFCGRKSHRVQTSDEEIYSIPVESIFNQHEEVSRTALISLGKGNVGLVVERKDKKRKLKKEQQEEFEAQLLKLAQKTSSTSKINKFFYHSSFPVDGRHNIKIDRLELGRIFRGEK